MGSKVVNLWKLATLARDTGMLAGRQNTIAVFMYQVGEIAKCSVYQEVAENKEDIREARLYHRLMQPAIADALMQLRLLANEYGLDLDMLIEDGLERFKQRIRDRGGDI